MKTMIRSLVCLLVFVPLVAGDAVATEEVTLEGSFVWARSDGDIDGNLKAILTPDGDGEWTVDFHFVWEEEPHVYSGTASGSLTEGALQGTAVSDGERESTFRFEGTVENGTFKGTHGFVGDDGSVREGGTLTLARAN